MSQLPIAIVEDDAAIRNAYSDLLSAYDCDTVLFESAEDFLSYLGANDADCLLLDQRLPGMSGLELQSALKVSRPGLKIVFITSQDDDITRAKALQNGAVRFLSKAGRVDEIVETVLELTGRSREHE